MGASGRGLWVQAGSIVFVTSEKWSGCCSWKALVVPRRIRMKIVCSTRTLKGDRRVRWQETISGLYAPLDFEIGDASSFSGEIGRASLGPLELTRAVVDVEFARGTRRHMARGTVDNCLVVLVKRGPLTVSQFGRECDLESGSYTMLDLSEPYAVERTGRTDSYFLKIAKPVLSYRIRDVEARCAVNRPAGSGVAAIGRDLIESLATHAATAASSATVLADHVIDFFGMVFDAGPDGLVESSSIACSGIRRRAVQYIDQNLADRDLSPDKIARALRISTRYLHRVFEESGRSVGRYIRTRRLAQCRDALLRARGTSLRISEISERYGFRNASHFSSSFKAEFGMSPSDVRPETPDAD